MFSVRQEESFYLSFQGISDLKNLQPFLLYCHIFIHMSHICKMCHDAIKLQTVLILCDKYYLSLPLAYLQYRAWLTQQPIHTQNNRFPMLIPLHDILLGMWCSMSAARIIRPIDF
jgi:hypothetical protein